MRVLDTPIGGIRTVAVGLGGFLALPGLYLAVATVLLGRGPLFAAAGVATGRSPLAWLLAVAYLLTATLARYAVGWIPG